MSTTTKELIARTGRVQSWIDDPTSRLPVSCTVFVVEDTMEGPNGIEASWRFVSHALRYGAGVTVHLSKLRARGAENDKGLVASGPVSFAKIYSTLNEILRRGGVYKNGAVVCHLDLNHPDVLEFITASRSELPWVKRCVNSHYRPVVAICMSGTHDGYTTFLHRSLNCLCISTLCLAVKIKYIFCCGNILYRNINSSKDGLVTTQYCVV